MKNIKQIIDSVILIISFGNYITAFESDIDHYLRFYRSTDYRLWKYFKLKIIMKYK